MLIEEELPEETTPQENAEEEIVDESAEGENQPTQEPAAEPEEAKYKLTYNGKEMELAVSDLITNAQKGMNYDHVKDDLDKQRKTSAETQAALERLTAALMQHGYKGSAQEMADFLEAQHRGLEPEQVRRERETTAAQEQARQEAEAAKLEAESIRREALFARDLLEIQRVNPNIKALTELGEQFFKLRAAGIENLAAYELLHKGKEKPVHAGKDHLIPTGGGSSSGGLAEIPKGELELWRDSFPEETAAKLRERYNRSLKRQSK